MARQRLADQAQAAHIQPRTTLGFNRGQAQKSRLAQPRHQGAAGGIGVGMIHR